MLIPRKNPAARVARNVILWHVRHVWHAFYNIVLLLLLAKQWLWFTENLRTLVNFCGQLSSDVSFDFQLEMWWSNVSTRNRSPWTNWSWQFPGISDCCILNALKSGLSWGRVNRELKQPRRRRQQKPHKFAYLKMKINSFARFARAFFMFWHFEDVLVLSTTWNDLFCSCVDDVSVWWQMFNLSS